MINIKNVQNYCCDDISLIENYDKAINDETQSWHCHHRLEIELNMSPKELKEINLYFNRPAFELVFLTKGEHKRIHNLIRMKGEKNPCYGRTGEKHPCYGRTGSKHPSYGVHRHRVYDNEEHTKYHYEI